VIVDSNAIYAGTIGVDFDNSFLKTFYGCHVLQAATATRFARESNANTFYGCTLRNRSTDPQSGTLVVHNGGHTNTFVGCDIENARALISVDAGEVFFTNCHFEGSAARYAITLSGTGSLHLQDCYNLSQLIGISGGRILRVVGTDFRGVGVSSVGWPFVRFTADVDTELVLQNNNVSDPNGCLFRTAVYFNGKGWTARTASKIKNHIIEYSPIRDDDFGATRTGGYLDMRADVALAPGLIAYKGGSAVTWGSAAPADGYWGLGAICYNTNPKELGTAGSKYTILGWRCIAAGTPGKWKEMRCLTGA
jgi:hypothetical protein